MKGGSGYQVLGEKERHFFALSESSTCKMYEKLKQQRRHDERTLHATREGAGHDHTHIKGTSRLLMFDARTPALEYDSLCLNATGRGICIVYSWHFLHARNKFPKAKAHHPCGVNLTVSNSSLAWSQGLPNTCTRFTYRRYRAKQSGVKGERWDGLCQSTSCEFRRYVFLAAIKVFFFVHYQTNPSSAHAATYCIHASCG